MNWLEHTRIAVISPDDVDIEDRAYYVPCFAPLTSLVASIEKIGVVNPPLLQESSKGKLAPVLGRRRLAAVRELGQRTLDARIVPSDMPIADGFAMAFWDNVGSRPLDQAAKAVVARRLMELFPKTVVASDFLPALGIAPRGPIMERLWAVGGLERTVLAEMTAGRILEKTAEILSRLDPQDRSICLSLMVQLGMNANKNAELIGNLFDLSVATEKSCSELLNSADAIQLLQDAQLPTIEKAERLRRLVRRWKFPELFRDQASFDEWRKGLSLPKTVAVRPSQSFEDPGCTIEVRVKSRDDAKGILNRILATK